MNQWRAALDQAVLLQKQPVLVVAFQQAALPEGMPTLIRLASDEGGRRKDLAQLVGLDEIQLQSAATEYLLQICLYPGSSNYRVLGLNSATDRKAAKEHHRLLLKWLHPDRNPDNQVLAGRVNQAWSAIKNNSNLSALATNAADQNSSQDLHQPPSAGRFPLFLWGLIGLFVLLLVVSTLPDSTIYVAESETDLPEGSISEGSASESNDGLLEKKLNALEFSFGEIKKAVLPTEKIKKKSSIEPTSTKSLSQKKPALLDKPGQSQVKSLTPKTIENTSSKLTLTDNNQVVLLIQPKVNDDKATVMSKTTQLEPIAEVKQNLQPEAEQLLLAFKQGYRSGNISAFMSNFSNSARNNRGNRQAIEDDYADFFSKSASRKINFSNEKWLFREDVVQYTAGYTATVRRKNGLISDTSKGGIEFVMSKENGRLLIQQVLLKE